MLSEEKVIRKNKLNKKKSIERPFKDFFKTVNYFLIILQF